MSAPGIPAWWPHSAWSQRLRSGRTDWHVQVLGEGPQVLLLHGAGASGHSWRRLLPMLTGYRLLVPDLPGQGFSRVATGAELGIDAMADELTLLCTVQGWRPSALIGHSAGAALALRLAEMLPNAPRALCGVNAALGPFEGIEGWLFPKLARAMAASPMVAHVMSRLAGQRARVERLITGTGSRLDDEGYELYRQLVADPSHLAGTLSMMAAWDLEAMLARLQQTVPPVLLIAATGDRAVPPQVSRVAAGRIGRAVYHEIPRYGHLVHEEAAGVVASLLLPFLSRHLGHEPAGLDATRTG